MIAAQAMMATAVRKRVVFIVGSFPGLNALFISLRWRVRVGRAGRDDWVLPRAQLKRCNYFRHRFDGPCVFDRHRKFFFGIENEVEQLRRAKFHRGREPVVHLVVEMQFPVSPFHRMQAVRAEQQDAFAVRGFLLTEQEIGLVYAVDGAVLRHGSAGDFGKGRERVHLVNDLITHATGGNFPRPTDDERRPRRAFHVREIVAAPRARTALMRKCGVWAIVGGEDKDGVVAHAQFVHGIKDLADAKIHFGQDIGKIAEAGPALEVWMRQHREVRLGHADIGVERLPGLHTALHEIDGAARNLSVNEAALFEVINFKIAALLAFPTLHDVFRLDARFLEPDRRRIEGFIGGARDAEPLVEPLTGGQPALVAAEMPLAEVAGAVTMAGEQLGNGDFPLRQSVKLAGERHGVRTAANGVASGQDGRAARRTLRLDVEVEQPRALGGELVNARRRRASKNAAAITADFAVAKVVHQDEDDVGFVRRVRRSDGVEQRERAHERGGDGVLSAHGFHGCVSSLVDCFLRLNRSIQRKLR